MTEQTSSEEISDSRSPGGALVVWSHQQRVIATVCAVVHSKQQIRRRFYQSRVLPDSIWSIFNSLSFIMSECTDFYIRLILRVLWLFLDLFCSTIFGFFFAIWLFILLSCVKVMPACQLRKIRRDLTCIRKLTESSYIVHSDRLTRNNQRLSILK